MPSRTLVSVDEYLHTSYDPDCDYVDGAIVERNVGETDHSDCQGRIYAYLLNRGKLLRIYPLVEERVQVSASRFRIPDVCVVAGGKPSEQVLTKPPLVAIEILSKDDSHEVKDGILRTQNPEIELPLPEIFQALQ